MVGAMTSATHERDVLAPTRLRRALASSWLRSRATLAHGLATLAALGVLVPLIEGHGVAWLAGVVAGASTAAWLAGLRAPSLPAARPVIDHGDQETREQLSLLQAAGWSAVHDLDARYARYRHVAIGPGGVILLQSQRLSIRGDPRIRAHSANCSSCAAARSPPRPTSAARSRTAPARPAGSRRSSSCGRSSPPVVCRTDAAYSSPGPG
jgi:hypothetical protein